MNGFRPDPRKCQTASAQFEDSAVKPQGSCPPPPRNEMPMPAHQPDRGPFPPNTSETAAPHQCRSVLIAELSRPGRLRQAIQQPANVTFAVRAMATPYSFTNQGRQLGGTLLQLQAGRLAKRAPQGIADYLTGVIIKPALHLFFDNRLQFVSK